MIVGALLVGMIAGFVSALAAFLLGTHWLWVLVAYSVVGSFFTVFAAIVHAASTSLAKIGDGPVPGADVLTESTG